MFYAICGMIGVIVLGVSAGAAVIGFVHVSTFLHSNRAAIAARARYPVYQLKSKWIKIRQRTWKSKYKQSRLYIRALKKRVKQLENEIIFLKSGQNVTYVSLADKTLVLDDRRNTR